MCLAKITYIVDIDKMEFLKYKIMKYKITIVYKLLVVYRTVRSLRGGCIYKSVDVMAVRVWCLPIYVILARYEGLPEDEVLTSKHVVANRM